MDNTLFPIAPGQDGPIVSRFLRYVDFGDGSLNHCWAWTGGKTPKGYGVFSLTSRKQVRAHRFAFRIYHGKEPSDIVLHSCDNPACVNPKHLSDGSHGENMRQMAERKRAAREERHHKSKLTFNEAAAILLLHRGGEYSTRELAGMFGVSQPTVAAISIGQLWPDASSAVIAMLAVRDAS